jgi:uncharacterized protein YebE (UPF0316 family)
MDFLLSPQAWLYAVLIFFLRVTDMSLDTLRMLFVFRGRRGLAWLLGFFEAAIFVLAVSSVITNLGNPLNVIGFAAGFATGNVVGMIIEERLAIGYIQLRVISSRRGTALADRLRTEGYAVTEIPARGRDGVVTLLSCSVRRKQVETVRQMVSNVDAEAFITAEEIRPLRRGFWRA